MPIQSNVPSRISQSNSADARAASKNGFRCDDTSCACGRTDPAGHRTAPMGQKVTTDLFLRQKQETAKYNLYMFMVKLLGLYGANTK